MDAQPVGPNQKLVEFHTEDGMVFKCLSKVLQKNFTNATFMVTEKGIFLQENTEKALVMLECMLKKENFLKYDIPRFETPGSVICLGFSTKDFKEAVDRIMKTDEYKMYILQSNYSILHIEITNPSKGSKIYKYITLKKTEISPVVSADYNDHEPTAVVRAAQFKKATTDANKNSKNRIKIRAQQKGVLLEGTTSQIRGFREVFGDWTDGQNEIYSEYLSTPKLHSFSDMAAAAKTIQIYACADDRPLKISCAAGRLGTVSYYLQPDVTQQEPQQQQNNNQMDQMVMNQQAMIAAGGNVMNSNSSASISQLVNGPNPQTQYQQANQYQQNNPQNGQQMAYGHHQYLPK